MSRSYPRPPGLGWGRQAVAVFGEEGWERSYWMPWRRELQLIRHAGKWGVIDVVMHRLHIKCNWVCDKYDEVLFGKEADE